MPTDRHRRSSSHDESTGSGGRAGGSSQSGSSGRAAPESGASRSNSSKSGSSKSRSSSSGRSKSKSKSRTGKGLSNQLGKLAEGIENGFKVFAEAANSIIDMILSVLFPKNLRKKVDKLGTSKQAKRVSKKVSKQVGKLTDNVEASFKKGASGFTEVFGFLFAILVPKAIRTRVEKIWKAVGDRVNKFFKRLNKGMASWAEKYLPPWLLALIKATNKRVVRTRKSCGKFLTAWFKSRDFVSLAWSTPAILLAMPVAALMALSIAQPGGARAVHYVRAAQRYDQEEQFEYSLLCRRKLAALGYKQMETQEYYGALKLDKNGKSEEAYEMMQTLASLSPEFLDRLNQDAEIDRGFLNRLNRSSEDEEPDDSAASSPLSIPTSPATSTNPSGLGISSSVTSGFDEAAFATALPSGADSESAEGEAKELSDDASAETDATLSREVKTAYGLLKSFGDDSDAEFYTEDLREAHIWIGQALLEGKIQAKTDRQKWMLIREHARIANLIHRQTYGVAAAKDLHDDDFGQETIQEWMSEVLLIEYLRNQGVDVIARMKKVAGLYEPYLAPVMRHFHARREVGSAMSYARKYVGYISKEYGYNEGKSWEEQREHVKLPSETQLVSLIEALSILRIPRAEELARAGDKAYPESEMLSGLHALVAQRDLLRLDPFHPNYTEKLFEIHQYAPKDVNVARRLAQQIKNERTIDIEEYIAQGRVGISLLFELGDAAYYSKGGGVLARKRYEKALEFAEESGDTKLASQACNNIAITMVDRLLDTYGLGGRDEALKSALEYVNKAIEGDQQITYYETLGRIHFEMRNYDNALDALNYALNGNLSQSDEISARRLMQRIYQLRGETQLARIHGREADRLAGLRGASERLGN